MSQRWVVNRLFKAQGARIDWGEEKRRLGYQGPELQADVDFAPLQFRWLLHPCLGLPRQPFVLWHSRHPGGNPTKQELANLPDTWKQVESIGLPVDHSWADTNYDLSPQGSPDKPEAPIKAALRRLQLGAPRIGWTRLTFSGQSLPDWQPSNLDAYLEDPPARRLLSGIRAMLKDRPNGRDHAAYVISEEYGADGGRMRPHLLLAS